MSRKIFDLMRTLLMGEVTERLLLKITNGRNNRDLICRITPNYYQYPSPTEREVSRGGLKVKVDISDYIGWYYYFGFEEANHESLYKTIKEDAIILDVGANIGLVSMQMALRAPRGRIFAIEPHPSNLSKLKSNLDSQKLACSVSVHNIGLSENSVSVGMSSPNSRNQGMNRVDVKAESTLKFETLDFFVTSNEIDHLDLIKIDVEGYELKVLRGGFETILSNHPVLFIELDDANLKQYGDSASELIDFLNSISYSVKRADNGMKMNPQDDMSGIHTDIYARYEV